MRDLSTVYMGSCQSNTMQRNSWSLKSGPSPGTVLLESSGAGQAQATADPHDLTHLNPEMNGREAIELFKEYCNAVPPLTMLTYIDAVHDKLVDFLDPDAADSETTYKKALQDGKSNRI